ncbi:hypothetical protein BHM03_00051385, partial [Ensete ventricosum]
QRLPLPAESHLALQPVPFAGTTLQAGVLAGDYCPCGLAIADRAYRRYPCRLLPLRRPPFQAIAPASDIGLPCGLALAAADRPVAGALGRGLTVVDPAWGLAVAGRPSSS